MCKEQRERELNLHSTMFLLILDALKAQSKTEIAFTFHNVSINSHSRLSGFEQLFNLHSTMFLLIPVT